MFSLKRIIKKIIVSLRATPTPPPENCWEVYKPYLKIHPSVIIDPSSTIKIFNSPDPPKICLEIGQKSHIFANFNVVRPQAKIKIGKRCQIGNVNFVCAQEIEVGDDVMMAWGINILDSDSHSLYWEERKNDNERCRQDYFKTGGFDLNRSHNWSKVETKKVIIQDKCWIGLNVTILEGVTLGEGVIVGAGSVVTKNVKPWHLVAGNPAKLVKKLKKRRI